MENLPRRVFADKEEPNGDRVNSYFKLKFVRTILRSLQPEEIEKISPAFGRLLEVNMKPTFSGKLVHFLLTRQLQVSRNHEIWVVFSGNPIRFGLREFEIVTGLNCSPLSIIESHRLTAPRGETPYWFTLFGGDENITGEKLEGMLRRAKSLSSELRIKYACLLLVDGVLCRKSMHMKIPKEHVEMIRDLDFFLKFPWGRLSFEMTMHSIKTRSVEQLSQLTVAVQGFIHALQLVVLQAVPASAHAVGDGTDPESGDDDNQRVITLKLDKIWEIDGDLQVDVVPIIEGINPQDGIGDYSWPTVVNDPSVDHMEQLISDGFTFTRDMFGGGRSGSIAKGGSKKDGKRKVVEEDEQSTEPQVRKRVRGGRQRKRAAGVPDGRNKSKGPSPSLDSDDLTACKNLIIRSVKEGCKNVEKVIEKKLEKMVQGAVEAYMKMKEADGLIKQVVNEVGASKNKEDDKVGEELDSEMPHGNNESPKEKSPVEEDLTDNAEDVAANSAVPIPSEAAYVSNNPKFRMLLSDVDLSREFEFGDGLKLKGPDVLAIAGSIEPSRSDVMDACILVMREVLLNCNPREGPPRAEILPCQFVVSLAMQYGKFKKATRKDAFDFDQATVGHVQSRMKECGKEWVKDIDNIYFPFNIDRSRWVGVCIDLGNRVLNVFDPCIAEMRTSRIKAEMEFVCEMFPYVVRKLAINEGMKKFPISPLAFKRNALVAQALSRSDSGMLALMMIEGHVRGLTEKMEDVVDSGGVRERAEQLVVDMYEHCCGDLEV